MPTLPRIDPGTRTIVAGRTGSGKTTFANWAIGTRNHQHWVILNPKHTSGYKSLPDAVVLHKWDSRKFDRAIKEHRFVILNFGLGETNPEFMDSVILWIHENYENIGICNDELYYLHEQGQAGDGLIALLTRGRERKQSHFGLTQRPKWLSLFCFTESDYIVMMQLKLEGDRKRMVEATGDAGFMIPVAKHHWRWYTVDDDVATTWGPVPYR